MNYHMHYAKLMERAKTRVLDVYSEKHHIQPKCLGGDNSPENVARLTPEEHYVAHQLLVKMYPGNYKLLWSVMGMTNGTKVMARNNKLYGWLRRQFAKEQSARGTGRPVSAETRQKQSEARLGKKRKPHSEETKRKMSEAAQGKKKSPEAVAAMSKARTGKKKGPHSPEWAEKIRQSNIEAAKHRDFGLYQTEEYKSAQAEKMRQVWADRKAGELPMPRRAKKAE